MDKFLFKSLLSHFGVYTCTWNCWVRYGNSVFNFLRDILYTLTEVVVISVCLWPTEGPFLFCFLTSILKDESLKFSKTIKFSIWGSITWLLLGFGEKSISGFLFYRRNPFFWIYLDAFCWGSHFGTLTEFVIMTLAGILCVLGMFAPSSLLPGGPQCLWTYQKLRHPSGRKPG